MSAFWEKMPIVEKAVPKSKKNSILGCELDRGIKFLRIYGGEDSTANFTTYD
jgi:hypothetical protein